MLSRSRNRPSSSDPLSAGMISAELNPGATGTPGSSEEEFSRAPAGRSLQLTWALLWAQCAISALQLFVLPWAQGRPLSPYALGPAMGIVGAYAMFAVHFTLAHGRARLPYAVFSGLLMTLNFASLTDPDRGVGTVLTGMSIALAGGALYGVLGHGMDAWLKACRQRIVDAPVHPAHVQRSETPARRRGYARRALAAAKNQAMAGMGWLIWAAIGIAAVARTGEAEALLPATVGLGPALVAGLGVLIAGLLKMRQAKQKEAALR